MAASTLVGPDFAGAEQLVATLERGGLPIVAALWRYPQNWADWRLIIASPTVDQEGSVSVYRRIHAALRRLPDVQISPRQVVAVGVADPFIAHLRTIVPPGFSVSDLKGAVSVPDYSASEEALATVYLYRLLPQDAAVS